MLGLFKRKSPDNLPLLLQEIGGGAHKRLDENRELLELLMAKAPDLLHQNPWIIGWLKANDEVFSELAAMSASLGLRERFLPRPGFPRPWPENRDLE
jgi:hypothetical protein